MTTSGCSNRDRFVLSARGKGPSSNDARQSSRGCPLTFFRLILHNVFIRRFRAAVTALAVAIGVMAVFGLGVLTSSLEERATAILKVGNSDFTVAQKNNSSILNSTITQKDVDKLSQVRGVRRVVGALIQIDKYDADHPAVIEVGLDRAAQKPFGVTLVQGRSYAPHSPNEVMLGYVLAQSIDKKVGDTMTIGDKPRKIVGLYSTNVSFGNSTMMYPLTTLQADFQLPGQVTLAFVQVVDNSTKASVDAVAKRIDKQFVQLTTIQTASDYGRADQTLVLIRAADTGGTILAAVIAITGVLNTTLLSFFERIREFGVLRSVGWSRGRVVGLVVGETITVSVIGAGLGLVFGWAAINVLENLSSLKGYFQPTYDLGVFVRALVFAIVVALLGALYPAIRAARLSPLAAIRRE